MATAPRATYLGFSVTDSARLYKLRVEKLDGEDKDFTISIPNRAFLEQRVRYQDAPEICLQKLENALDACEGAPPASRLKITREDLDAYRNSHTKSVQRRFGPPLKS